MHSNLAKQLMVGIIMAQTGGRIAIEIDSAVLPDTRDLIRRKGWQVRGASVNNTQQALIVGKMLYCIPNDMDKGAIQDMLRADNFTIVPMSSEKLAEGMEKLPDEAPREKDVKMADALEREFNQLAQISGLFRDIFGTNITDEPNVARLRKRGEAVHAKMDAQEKNDDSDPHALRLNIGAVLPNGEVLQAEFCRNCAMDFIEGRSKGDRYHSTKFLRTLMAFVISTADEEQAEKEITEKAIKASLETSTRH